MPFLAFQLYAPLASFGEPAVGEARPSHNWPGRSMVLGLLAAALGLHRDDDPAHRELADAHAVAVAVYADGTLLRDYHTSQVAGRSDLKKRPHLTRADELAFPSHQLHTILSARDYRQDACSVILVAQRATPSRWPLATLRDALLAPRFTLYLGRKACPPAWPLQPQLVDGTTLRQALQQTDFIHPQPSRGPLRLQRIAWEDGLDSGFADASVYSVPRHDEPRSRSRWQFAARTEHVALLTDEDSVSAAEETAS